MGLGNLSGLIAYYSAAKHHRDEGIPNKEMQFSER